MHCYLIILDSVGIGEAPDAAEYSDVGSSTLPHTAEICDGLHLPVMQKLGLGNIPHLLPKGIMIKGVPPANPPIGSYGALMEVSKGKDTTTGHWELAGLKLDKGFRLFPQDAPSFPPELIEEFVKRTGRSIMGNCAASGTKIIEEMGMSQIENGKWIVYTSADSVLQIAAHEEIIPLEELYSACKIARDLCNKYYVGRVIARPYIGKDGHFTRTENRRDFSYPLPEKTILDYLSDNNIKTTTVGKLDDIFIGNGISESFHVENNKDAQETLLQIASTNEDGFVFANLIDFDMLYGHRRDAKGYGRSLENTDVFLEKLLPLMKPDDVLMITADHGNDPTFEGTDHTREYVPLLAYSPASKGNNIGIRNGFYDVAQTVASLFEISPMSRGISFADSLRQEQPIS